MPVTGDPETTWGAIYAGGVASPGIKIDLSSFIGKLEYNAGIFKYASTIGIQRDVEINPTALISIINKRPKSLNNLVQFPGNYDIQVSEYTNIALGNQLNLQRSRVSYISNREYKGGIKASVFAIIAIMALADFGVVYALRYGTKTDAAVKSTVGGQQIVYSASLVLLHYLETLGVEAKAELLNLSDQLKTILDTLTTLVGKNANTPDILNPLLINNRIKNIKTVAETALNKANNNIASVSTAIVVAGGQAPGSCWVARAVYGPENPRWIIFRRWLFGSGPVPETRTLLQRLYMRHGERFAQMVDKSSCLRRTLRMMMDLILWIDQKTSTGASRG